jgi:hypothetical protein
MTSIESAAFISFQPGAEPTGQSDICPEAIASPLNFPLKYCIWINNLKHPFRLPEIPRVADCEIPPRQDLIAYGSAIAKFALNLKRIIHVDFLKGKFVVTMYMRANAY